MVRSGNTIASRGTKLRSSFFEHDGARSFRQVVEAALGPRAVDSGRLRLIVGDDGCGKRTMVRSLLEKHAVERDGPRVKRMPLVHVSLGMVSVPTDVLLACLGAIGCRIPAWRSKDGLLEVVRREYGHLDVRAVMFTDADALAIGREEVASHKVFRTIDLLLRENRFDAVLVGSPLLRDLFRVTGGARAQATAKMLRARLRDSAMMYPFGEDTKQDFVKVLQEIDRIVSADGETSFLETAPDPFLEATDGSIGRLVNLVELACEIALSCKREHLVAEDFAEAAPQMGCPREPFDGVVFGPVEPPRAKSKPSAFENAEGQGELYGGWSRGNGT